MIKVEVPLDNPAVLKKVGEMFMTLAGESQTTIITVGDQVTGEINALKEVAADLKDGGKAAEDVINSITMDTDGVYTKLWQSGRVEYSLDQVIWTEERPAVTGPSVDLADGIPWDARIHSAGKTKYAKAPHSWKLKRGVTPEVVAAVEAELRAVMAAGPDNPVTTEPDAAETFAPPPPDDTAGPITNFAELAMAIAKNKTDEAVLLAAVNKVGIQSFPLLAARADLIPAVVAELFPGSV